VPALRTALKILGYDEVYHGYTAGMDNPRDCKMWLEACEAKFEGKGTVYGKDEFDQLLGHCQVSRQTLLPFGREPAT
jgi:hypothetical protein